MATATEAKSAGRALRRPLQPRDSNVASPTVASAAALAGKGNGKTKARTRLAAATPASPPPSVVRPYVKPEGSRVECPLKEVSLAEELEKARERRGRLRVARQLTDRVLDEREEALRWEVSEWERRAQEQRRLVAELMRLIGMPEVYTPLESLRSKEERKRKDAISDSGSPDSASTASVALQEQVGVDSCGQELDTLETTATTATTSESTF